MSVKAKEESKGRIAKVIEPPVKVAVILALVMILLGTSVVLYSHSRMNFSHSTVVNLR